MQRTSKELLLVVLLSSLFRLAARLGSAAGIILVALLYL